jgi:hypothetical protein
VDSTAQNPTFSYTPGCSPITVSLTASNACRVASTSLQVVPEPNILTLFNANNAGGANGGVYFDVVVTNPDGISVCGFSQNYNGAANTPVGAVMHSKSDTSVGFENNAAAWTNRGSVLVNSAPFNQETIITLPTPFYLPPGTHGIAIQATGLGHAYSGTGANPAPGATSYSNSDVTLNLGRATNVIFTGTPFSPRIWNGRLNYRTTSQGMAGYYTFAAGCAGTFGVPGNVNVSLPVMGQNLSVNFTNIPAGVFVFYGFSNTIFQGTFPLPIDMGPIGAAGCPILISTDVNAAFLVQVGNVCNWTIGIPNVGIFLGVHFYTQAFSFDPVNALGGVVSDGATAVIGNT